MYGDVFLKELSINTKRNLKRILALIITVSLMFLNMLQVAVYGQSGAVPAGAQTEQGKPAPKKNTQTFKDVPVKHSFYRAIQWASEQGITAGYSDGTFGVNRTCTRGHCVTFLYRLLG